MWDLPDTHLLFSFRALFTSKLGLNLKKKLVKYHFWNIVLYDAAMWTLRKVDQKYVESFAVWCWTRMEISWTDHV